MTVRVRDSRVSPVNWAARAGRTKSSLWPANSFSLTNHPDQLFPAKQASWDRVCLSVCPSARYRAPRRSPCPFSVFPFPVIPRPPPSALRPENKKSQRRASLSLSDVAEHGHSGGPNTGQFDQTNFFHGREAEENDKDGSDLTKFRMARGPAGTSLHSTFCAGQGFDARLERRHARK